MAIRSPLAHIRAACVSPAVFTAPPAGFVPLPQGIGLPFHGLPDRGNAGDGCDDVMEGGEEVSRAKEKAHELLEERVARERDAWRGALDALTQPRDARRADAEAEGEDGNAFMNGVERYKLFLKGNAVSLSAVACSMRY